MQSYNNMLGDYQTDVSNWVTAVTTRSPTAGTDGVFGMITEGWSRTVEGMSFVNIGCAALVLRNLLKVSELSSDFTLCLTQLASDQRWV